MNTLNILDAVDPATEPLVSGQFYSIAGLINGPISMVPVADRGLLIFKVPIYSNGSNRAPGVPCQAIVEIFCKNKAMEPRFAKDWRILQLMVVRNATYDQSYEHHGLKFHKFRLLPSDPCFRYIWLSSPRPNFWQMPVSKPENPRLQAARPFERHDFSVVCGVMEKSPGSVLGSKWSVAIRNICTHATIAGNKFHNWAEQAIQYKRWIEENPVQLLLANDSFAHNIGGENPLMHV